MGTAMFIIFLVFCFFWLQARHCWKRSKVQDGNIEAVGGFFYSLVCIILGIIEVILGITWAIQAAV